nr:SLOG family protein [Maliibacterium massiliense]
MSEAMCCFAGHRYLSTAETTFIQEYLPIVIQRCVLQKGIRVFACGGALGFDTLAAYSVLALEKVLPDMLLHLVLPCRDQALRWREADAKRHAYLCAHADKTVILQEQYAEPQPLFCGS